MEVNGVWWPPSSSKRVGRVIPVRWVRFLPPPPASEAKLRRAQPPRAGARATNEHGAKPSRRTPRIASADRATRRGTDDPAQSFRRRRRQGPLPRVGRSRGTHDRLRARLGPQPPVVGGSVADAVAPRTCAHARPAGVRAQPTCRSPRHCGGASSAARRIPRRDDEWSGRVDGRVARWSGERGVGWRGPAGTRRPPARPSPPPPPSFSSPPPFLWGGGGAPAIVGGLLL